MIGVCQISGDKIFEIGSFYELAVTSVVLEDTLKDAP